MLFQSYPSNVLRRSCIFSCGCTCGSRASTFELKYLATRRLKRYPRTPSQVEQWYFQQWLGISKDLISRNLDISYIVSSGEQTDQIDSNAACKVLYLISLGRCLRKKWQLAQHLPLMCCELVAPFLPNEKFRARPNARTMRPNARTMMCWSCISEDWWGFCGISTYSKWWKIKFCHICYILSNSIS